MTTERTYTAEELEAVADDISQKYLQKPFTFSDNAGFSIFTTLRYDPLTYTGKGNLFDALNATPLDESFFFLLSYHVDKLRRSGDFFGFPTGNLTTEILLNHLTNALVSADRLIAHRIKVTVSKDGLYGIEHAPLPESNTLTTDIPDYHQFQKASTDASSNIPGYLQAWTGWTLYLDHEKVQPSMFTSFKTTRREVYNQARNNLNIVPGDRREVLLQDNNNNVLEGSITSVAFWRQQKDPFTGEVSFKWVTPNLASGCMDGVIRRWLLDKNHITEGVVAVKDLKDGEYVLLMNGLMGIKVAKLVL